MLSLRKGTAVANFKPTDLARLEITPIEGRRAKGRKGRLVVRRIGGESQGFVHRPGLTGETMPLSTRVVFDVGGDPLVMCWIRTFSVEEISAENAHGRCRPEPPPDLIWRMLHYVCPASS